MRHRLPLIAMLSVVSLPACARAQVNQPGAEISLLPPGYGVLKQDFIMVRLRTGTLQIQVMPVDERLIRLLAPDAYGPLHQLLLSQRRVIDSIASSRGVHDPGIALVSFHALAPDTRFDPAVLTVSSRSRQYRPIGFVPLTPTFSNQQLDVREQASGLFIYEQLLPIEEAFTVSYLDSSNEEWGQKLPRIESERSRILGRIRTQTDTIKP